MNKPVARRILRDPFAMKMIATAVSDGGRGL